jgi:hypothetical protein
MMMWLSLLRLGHLAEFTYDGRRVKQEDEDSGIYDFQTTWSAL